MVDSSCQVKIEYVCRGPKYHKYCIKAQNITKLKFRAHLGLQKKGQGLNLPIKAHLKQVGGGPNPWMGKLWALEK